MRFGAGIAWRTSAALLTLVVLAGCVPASGDDLVDDVARRVDPFSSCLAIGQTRVFARFDEPGPPALLMPDAFVRADVRKAAGRIAVRWQETKSDRVKILAPHGEGRCLTQVDRPAYARDFAFVSYTSRSGKMGAMAFQRRQGIWQEVENVSLGYW